MDEPVNNAFFVAPLAIAAISLAAAAGAQVRARAESDQRWLSRAVFYYDSLNGGEQNPVQVVVENGAPRWKDEYLRVWADLSVGGTWRLGCGWWTSLDTNTRMRIGAQKLAPGRYLLLVRKGEAGAELVILEADATLAETCDPTMARSSRRDRIVPLDRDPSPVVQRRLQVGVELDSERTDRGRLEIRFGPMIYHAPVEVVGVRGTVPQYQRTSRGRSRLLLQDGDGDAAEIVGECTIGFPLVPWSQQAQQELDGLRAGQRWDLGLNPWTELTTTTPLVIAGRKVGPGTYYAVVERSGRDGDYELVLLDADRLRARKTDSQSAFTTKGGIRVALSTESGPPMASLDFGFRVLPGGGAVLAARFGTVSLEAPVTFAGG